MIVYRSLNRVSGPSIEPVTLAEAKAHARVDTSTDDAYFGSLITLAREYCEDYLDSSLINTQWRMKMDNFGQGFSGIEIPRPPMSQTGTTTTVVVTYTVNTDGTTTTLSTNDYRVDRSSTPGRIYPLYGGSWPSHLSDANAVTVTWYSGYGASASDVPSKIKHAMLLLIGTYYERRLGVDSVSSVEIPFGVKALLDMTKWGAFQ